VRGRRSSQGPRLGCAFYRTDGGHEPVREWLRDLGKEVTKAIGSDILTVQWNWPVGKPLVDGLGGGLYEVRSTHGRREYRVFFCISASTIIVLLHGIVKKTRTTPRSDLELARRRLREVTSR
jgi:phage-related protein